MVDFDASQYLNIGISRIIHSSKVGMRSGGSGGNRMRRRRVAFAGQGGLA
jgi:hypothetical protein